MISEADITERASRMKAGLAKAYGIRSDSLGAAVEKAGRRLPARVRQRLEPLLSAEAMGGNPRLLRTVDARRLRAGEKALIKHLKTVDRSAARRAAVTDWALRMGVSIFFVLGGVFLWLILAGHI